NIWNESLTLQQIENQIIPYFTECCIYLILLERICLERAFNKIRIKGGRCNPCCVAKIAQKMYGLY
ncbi:hypothetical protein LCGC14_3004320, partial [marine sediment metagenome]